MNDARLLDASERAFFGIVEPQEECRDFSAYLLSVDEPFPENWELVAICHLRQDPQLLKLWLMHIDALMVDDGAGGQPSFDPLTEAQDYLQVNRQRLESLVQLLTRHLHRQTGSFTRSRSNPIEHFQPVGSGELIALHVPSPLVNPGGLYYRYNATEGVVPGDEVTLLRIPRVPSDDRGVAALELATFKRGELNDPTFHPLDTQGHGAITLDQPALQELIALLQHSLR